MGKRTQQNFWGHAHFDENGAKTGQGGKTTHYDAAGNKTGETYRNAHGHMTHYDADGNKIGTSYEKPSGTIAHFDSQGNRIGESHEDFWNRRITTTNDSGGADGEAGCYTLIGGAVLIVLIVVKLIFG